MRYEVTHVHAKDRGFSFIELLAYMAIAALLILAAIPQFNNYRGQARDQAVMNDVRNVSIAYEAWSISHPGEAFPLIYNDFRGGTSDMDTLTALGVTLSTGTSLWAGDRVAYSTPASTVFVRPGQAFCVIGYNLNGGQFNNDTATRLEYHSGNGGMGAQCKSK